MKKVRVTLLGCGNVGGGFVRLLEAERERIHDRFGIDPRIVAVLVRDTTKGRPALGPALVTSSALEALEVESDLVVELIGGIHTAGALIRGAIARGRHVVTANKALLATSGGDLTAAAARAGVTLGFEASVCGAIPVVRTITDGFAGDSIEEIQGILNGTSNFILSQLERGTDYASAIAKAIDAGFAEAEATLDTSGEDAEQKLRILAALAFADPVRTVARTGIEGVTVRDCVRARRAGCVLRQIATAVRVAGGVALDVRLTAVRREHPLASIVDEANGIVIRGRAAGELFLRGKGAGSGPTATAVLADVLMAVRAHRGRALAVA